MAEPFYLLVNYQLDGPIRQLVALVGRKPSLLRVQTAFLLAFQKLAST